MRIIPTRVGTSVWELNYYFTSGDHPHACGDKSVIGDDIVTDRGSSPRVWGQGYVFRISPRGDRIIPTRVGTSQTID